MRVFRGSGCVFDVLTARRCGRSLRVREPVDCIHLIFVFWEERGLPLHDADDVHPFSLPAFKFARSRWYGPAQVDDSEVIQSAMDSCPVDCIHWVPREELPYLEHVMTKLPRANVHALRTSTVISACPFQASAELRERETRRASRHWSRWRRPSAAAAAAADAAAAAAVAAADAAAAAAAADAGPAEDWVHWPVRSRTYSVPASRAIAQSQARDRRPPQAQRQDRRGK